MQAVILAGGKGTRLYPFTKNTPKALIKIGERPLVEHQILLLKEYGIKEIWLLLGYLGDQIRNYFQEGKRWNVNIHYCQEEKPLGTAGALKVLEGKIKKDFLVLSGDVMLNFDVKRFIDYHRQKKGNLATIVVHPNGHPFDSDLVEVDRTGKVVSLLKRPHPAGLTFHNLSIASQYIFSPKILKYIPENRKTDIEKYLLPKILKSKNKIYTYNTPEYIQDIGTPKRLKEVRRDYVSGKVRRLNLRNKRKAIFLDRDGVINKEIDQLSALKDLKIYSFAAPAIKKINQSEYLTVLVTNQPMVAKGFLTQDELDRIHKKIETELAFKGAKIDAIYYCPHHPEKGFTGEISELKIKCDCRKPKIGLIKRAVKDFNLDLSKSFLIGDSSVDIKTAENARIKFIGVETGYGCRDGRYKTKKTFPIYKNLLTAVNSIGI